jgi:hypothetical protein
MPENNANFIYKHSIDKNNNTNIISLNGYIYRADKHSNYMLRKFPAYFGSLNSALEYFEKEFYMKKYKTKKELKIILLDGTQNNIRLLQNMYKNMINREKTYNINNINNTNIRLEYILIQVLYGMILDKFNKIDLCDMSFNEIYDNLLLLCKKISVKTKEPVLISEINIFIYILATYSIQDEIKPSRMSVRYLDRILMHLMNETFESKYDGIYYNRLEIDENTNIKSESLKIGENDLCYLVNKEIYKMDRKDYSCAPSEICIWNPKKNLDLVEMLKNKDGKNILINLNHHKNIKKYMKKRRWHRQI